jgi:hypothetical protein
MSGTRDGPQKIKQKWVDFKKFLKASINQRVMLRLIKEC